MDGSGVWFWWIVLVTPGKVKSLYREEGCWESHLRQCEKKLA
jgi:hypothetical protein